MADSKTDSVMTEKTLEADHHFTSSPTESRGSDLEKSMHEDHEKTPEYITESPQRASIDPDVEHGISLVNPVEDKDEEGGAQETTTEHDPNVVDWDSPDDPERAINWTSKKKWTNQAIIACVTFLTPLASSMVAPGVPEILHDFNTTNETIGAMVVSIYILGYALGPLFIAPMSEVYGRLITYHVNNILFVVWTIACALAPNVGSLLAFRVLAGIAGSCPITIGGGSIADLFKQEQRGGAMALFALGPLMGPVIGPVAGGYLAQAKGWRWVFWVIAIAGGVACTCSITFMRETYEPLLLQRKVNRLKKETGNQNLRSKLDSGLPVRAYFVRALVRPTKMLFLSPIVLALSIYMAVVYGYLYLLFTTLTLVFERDYGFSGGNVGLVFLGIGLGSLLGLLIFGMASDKIVKRMSAKGEMKPEYRLPPLMPGSMVIPIGLFWYGWSAEAHIHWIMPIIGTMWVGLGLLATFMPIQTYLVDAFTIHAASAIAANTVLRSLVGAFLPLAGPKMYAALGLGWGNSLLAFIAIALAPTSWIFFKYGERIRKSPRFQVTF
jgi:multidrug resistance protein